MQQCKTVAQMHKGKYNGTYAKTDTMVVCIWQIQKLSMQKQFREL